MSGTVIALGRLFAIYPGDSSAKGRREVTNHFVS